MITSESYWHSHPRIRTSIAALAQGAVIAYPTEAVWGLGCDPFNAHAVNRILTLKKRSASKGLILVASSLEQIDFLLDGISEEQRQLLEASWPGPTTWLIPHKHRIPANVSGDSTYVAVRVSAHPVVRALCHGYGGPIVSTSANVQGQRPARTSLDVHRYFRRYSITIAPGMVGKRSRPSEIKNLATGETLRA